MSLQKNEHPEAKDLILCLLLEPLLNAASAGEGEVSAAATCLGSMCEHV